MSKSPIMQTGIKWLWLTILLLTIDQITKYFAHTYIGKYETIEVMPFFNWVLRYNEGAAFSFLADAGGWQVYFLSGLSILVSLGITFWMYKTPASNRILSIGLSLVLAGAIGNLIDRLRLEKVIDFVDWYYPSEGSCFWGFSFYGGNCHWPAFNVADGVILLGAIMLLLDGYFNPEKKAEDKAS